MRAEKQTNINGGNAWIWVPLERSRRWGWKEVLEREGGASEVKEVLAREGSASEGRKEGVASEGRKC